METRNISINRQDVRAPASKPSQVTPHTDKVSTEVPGIKKTGKIPRKRTNQTKVRNFRKTILKPVLAKIIPDRQTKTTKAIPVHFPHAVRQRIARPRKIFLDTDVRCRTESPGV